MQHILIDTDVIMDFFFDRKPFADNAEDILSLCETQAIAGYVTPVIISNVYYLLRKTATHEKITEKLDVLLSILNVLNMDKAIIRKALISEFKDFEDALQNFAAEANGRIRIIVTRNVKDYKHSSLSIMLPDTFLAMV